MREIDSNACYRLIDVQDHSGNSKVEARELYIDRIGCIATNVRINPWYDLYEVVRMDFAYAKDNVPINRPLRTSPISELLVDEEHLNIRTQNSLYIFSRVTPPEVMYQDVADLIELYLTDEEYNFAAGYYYDEEKKPHKLDCSIHVGMITDSCLICFEGGIVCRYFPCMDGVTFYNTIYKQQDYSHPILIHNVGRDALRVKFEGFNAVWTLLPGQQKTIQPYCKEGADDEVCCSDE